MVQVREEYQRVYSVQFADQLGEGKDGYVLKTRSGHAVKFVIDLSVYQREARAYEILRRLAVEEVSGFQIPKLIRKDDSLQAIEMTIVQPPFILDFAAAYTRREYERLAFTEEVLQERLEHWMEVFEEKWRTVRDLRDEFERRTGLILLDLSLNNIRFQ